MCSISLSVAHTDEIPLTKTGNIMCTSWHNTKLSKQDQGIVMCVTLNTTTLADHWFSRQQECGEACGLEIPLFFAHTFFSLLYLPHNARWICPCFWTTTSASPTWVDLLQLQQLQRWAFWHWNTMIVLYSRNVVKEFHLSKEILLLEVFFVTSSIKTQHMTITLTGLSIWILWLCKWPTTTIACNPSFTNMHACLVPPLLWLCHLLFAPSILLISSTFWKVCIHCVILYQSWHDHSHVWIAHFENYVKGQRVL